MDPEKCTGAGYFRVPMTTMRAIVDANPDPDALAAWLILRRFAYGSRRELTSTGAKKIAGALSMTRPRAKKLILGLLAIRYGERGESAVLMTASDWNAATGHDVPITRGAAPVYVMPDPGGDYAYLPDLLIPPGDGVRCYLADLCEPHPVAGLDTLRLLIQVHAAVSCGDFLGADPGAFARTEWELDGTHSDFELGHIGVANGRHYWLAREADLPSTEWAAIEAVAGGREESHAERFWAALAIATERGLLFRIAIVSDPRGRLLYPLWAYGVSHRDRLADLGVMADLARCFHRKATSAGLDTAEELGFRAGTESGTGLFICATATAAQPTIRTVYAPTFIAPTRDNMAGMATVACLSHKWQ